VVQADLLLHVVDASHPQAEEQIQSVNAVLEEIGAAGKPTIMVFNKLDRLQNNGNGNGNGHKFHERHRHVVGVSALTGAGLPELLEELGTQIRPLREFIELSVPHSEAAVIARLHAVGQVVERDYNGEKAWFKVRIPPHLHEEFAPFMVRELQTA
jgi:GTPase